MYWQPDLRLLVQQRHEGALRFKQERHLAEQVREVCGSGSGRDRMELACRAWACCCAPRSSAQLGAVAFARAPPKVLRAELRRMKGEDHVRTQRA
jgi:hypothetical protein